MSIKTYKIKELPLGDAKKYFSKFQNSGLHGASWRSTAYCIFEYTLLCGGKEELCIVQNLPQGGRHAESLLLEHLKSMEEKILHLGYTVYINYSPCGSCSQLIRDFLSSQYQEIKFVFAQLYDINRQSCRERCPPHYKCNKPKGDETRKGLLEIKDHLEPFDQGHWEFLKQLLNKYVDKQRIYTREDEDDYLRSDWDHLITSSAEDDSNLRMKEFGNLSIGTPSQGCVQGGLGTFSPHPFYYPLQIPSQYYMYQVPRPMASYHYQGWYPHFPC